MKAISLWEPWASLIATGAKRWETRGWNTAYRGELLICAAKGGLRKSELTRALDDWAIQGGLAPLRGVPLSFDYRILPIRRVWIEHLNFGKAVAIAELVAVWRTEDAVELNMIGTDMPFGDYRPGRFAWKLENVRPIRPFPVKGSQGFFNVDTEAVCASVRS
jgi:hypothetical protein